MDAKSDLTAESHELGPGDRMPALASGGVAAVWLDREDRIREATASAAGMLGFEPQGADRNGKDHVIDVKVPRPGVTVRARRALPLAAPRDQREILAATLRSPLPAIELPLRVTTYAARDTAAGKVRVVVSGEIGRGGTSPAGLAVAFALVDDKGKVAGSSFQPGPLGRRKMERLTEQLDGLSPRGETGTPLQIAQAAHTQPRLGCQVFLRQTSRQPISPEQVAKAVR